MESKRTRAQVLQGHQFDTACEFRHDQLQVGIRQRPRQQSTGPDPGFCRYHDRASTPSARRSLATRPSRYFSRFRPHEMGESNARLLSFSFFVSQKYHIDIEDVRDRERAARKAERKREKDRRERYLDEVAPKAEGREAQLLKRRAQNAYHKRERSPDVELNETDMYGGGDDFKAMLAAQKRREARQEERREERQRQRYGASTQERMAQMRAKEDATMAMLREMAANRKAQGGL